MTAIFTQEQELILDRKHLKCLRRLKYLRPMLEPHYHNWSVAIDPGSGVYMVEQDLMVFYRRTNIYFPKTLELGLYRINDNPYIGKI